MRCQIELTLHVPSIVPESNDRPGKIAFIAQGTKTRRAQHEVPAIGCWCESQPAGCEDPNEMSAREEQYVSANGLHSGNNPVRTGSDLFWAFTARAAVAEQVPVRAFRADICTPASFVLAVIPLDQIGVDLRHRAIPCKFASVLRTLQRACKHPRETQPAQALAEPPGSLLAPFRQGKVSEPSVLPR